MNSEVECLYCIDDKKYADYNDIYMPVNEATLFFYVMINNQFPILRSFQHYVAICNLCYDRHIKDHQFNKHFLITKEEYLASTIVEG